MVDGSFRIDPAAAADAHAVTAIVVAMESLLYGRPSDFSEPDLLEEWAELDVGRDARVVREGDRVVGYGVVRERGELARVEGYVDPGALGRGIGTLIAETLEREAAAGGARRVQNAVLEPDAAAHALLESLGYAAVRVFREMRIVLDAPPPAPAWPDGLRVVPFDPERDARDFHAAHQEAFADHWEFTPRGFASWSQVHLVGARFDPALWGVVRRGTPSPRGRSARAPPTAAASCTQCSPAARGAGGASARRSSPTRSDGCGRPASAASASGSTRRATPARSVSTSAPG